MSSRYFFKHPAVTIFSSGEISRQEAFLYYLLWTVEKKNIQTLGSHLLPAEPGVRLVSQTLPTKASNGVDWSSCLGKAIHQEPLEPAVIVAITSVAPISEFFKAAISGAGFVQAYRP